MMELFRDDESDFFVFSFNYGNFNRIIVIFATKEIQIPSS